MAEVDTSIYKNAVPQTNILATLGQGAGVLNALTENQILRANLQAKGAISDAIAGATDQSGNLDTNKLIATVAQDPRAAYLKGDAITQALAQHGQQIANQSAQLDQHYKNAQFVQGQFGALADKPDLKFADVMDVGLDLYHKGIMTPQQIAQEATEIGGLDSKGLQAKMREYQLRNLNVMDQITAAKGQLQPINTGSQTQIIQTPILGGPTQVRGTLTNTLSPEAAASRVPVNVNGQAGTVPLGSLGAPGQRAAAPAAPGTPNAPAGFVPSAAAPGVAQDVERYKADQSQVPTRQTNVQSLQKALHALELTRAGKGTAASHAMYSFLNTEAPGLLPAGLNDDVANYDLFKKYTTDYARQAAGGAGTNLQLEMASASNPGTEISTQANMDVLKTNIGRERQRIAQVLEAPDSTGVGYGKHAAAFATATDPRAFAFDSYTAAERQKLLAGLKGAQLSKFKRSLEIAADHGLINVPGQ